MADNPEARSEKVSAIAVNAQSAGWKTRTPPEQPQAGGASRSPQETFVQEGRAPATILDALPYTDMTPGRKTRVLSQTAERPAKKSPAARRGSGLGSRVVHLLGGGQAAWYP